MNGQVRFAARSAAILGALYGLLAWQLALAFNFEDVAQRARQLAAASFKPQESKLPSEIEKLTYDEFRDIRFKPACSLRRGAAGASSWCVSRRVPFSGSWRRVGQRLPRRDLHSRSRSRAH